ncbi:MAG: oligosaccharide flippase family protein, partial [Gammaproteobacteria bacterium]|nr:oligosaccharide flippase family protein [Gammaproteobacteria bacterium]
LYRTPQIFINAVSQSLPVLMLASFFGPAQAGFYAIGRAVLGVPSTLIGQSVGDVFYPRIAEAAHNGENLTRLILKATLALAVAGFAPFAIVVAFGPWLFGYVFGAEWVTAGEYARWLALWMFFMFLNNPSVNALPILSAQGFHLIFTIFTIATRVIMLAAGYYVFDSDLVAVALFGASGAIINILLIGIIHIKIVSLTLKIRDG